MDNKKKYQQKGNYKQNCNRKGNKYNPKDKADKSKEAKEQYTTKKSGSDNVLKSGYNEPSWYNSNDRLVQDAVKIPFTNQLGRPLEMGNDPLFTGIYGISDYTVPGIMVLQMVNTPGIAKNASDGVNLAASMIFQKMRKDLSTYASYSAADVIMYCLGIDSIYSQYANIARLFGLCGAYSSYNLYAPRDLICGAYGFSYAEFENIVKNLNDYRARFNNLIFKASTLYLPVDFSIISRHSWLYSNYFLDTIGRKSQMYIHRMMGFHKLNETLSNNGTALEYIEHATTLSGLLDEFAVSIEMYRNSDSMLKIAADMRRAYQESSSWQLAYVDENFLIPPMPMDDHLRNQVHNLDIFPTAAYNEIKSKATKPEESLMGTWHVGQDVNKNIVVFQPEYVKAKNDLDHYYEFAPLMCNKLIDFNHEEVTSDDILEATRNVLRCYASEIGNNVHIRPVSCGADICVGLDFIRHSDSGTAPEHLNLTSGLLNPVGEIMRFFPTIECFASAPYFFTFIKNNEGTIIGTEPFCEFDNYTVVDPNVINLINNVVTCNMWSIPSGIGV